MKLTKAQVRVLSDMSSGGCFFAALREPSNYLEDDVLFSESIGIVVCRPGHKIEDRYRIRNATAAPLYLDGLVGHANGASGYREFNITDLGRAALEGSQSK